MADKAGQPEGEWIATVGSPSTTTSLALEVLEDAARKRLVGSLIWFKMEQEGAEHYALGQITEVELRNVMLEMAEIRSLARQRGSVNPISGVQDTHKGFMTTGSVFKLSEESYTPSTLGTVPPTGTPIYKADEAILQKLLARYQSRIFYLGNFYESDLKLPLWFDHFGSPDQGGAGEAYHIGIYGMTGSGKSTLAKTIMMAYARHESMAIFVFDPSGEFRLAATGKKKPSDGLFIDIGKVARDRGKEVITVSVADLVLDRWDLFEELLYESDFFQSLTVPKRDNRRVACRVLITEMKGAKITLANLHKHDSFKEALEILRDSNVQAQIYASKQPRDRFASAVNAPPKTLYETDWEPTAALFDTKEKRTVDDLVWRTFYLKEKNRPIVIIDLSGEGRSPHMLWNSEIRAILINRIVGELKFRGREAYNADKMGASDNSLNTLVILDEAQRLVPRDKFGEEKQDQLRDTLVDAVQTTRKYGLGWMFISLSLSTLHREIYHENRIAFYGFGLNSVSEMNALKELIPDNNSLKLYQSFRDPHALEPAFRTYSFMSRGPVSPLSSSGSPLFLTMFRTFEEFLDENTSA